MRSHRVNDLIFSRDHKLCSENVERALSGSLRIFARIYARNMIPESRESGETSPEKLIQERFSSSAPTTQLSLVTAHFTSLAYH